MKQRDFMVKRGNCCTYFQHAQQAFAYWRAVLGSVLYVRRSEGWRHL